MKIYLSFISQIKISIRSKFPQPPSYLYYTCTYSYLFNCTLEFEGNLSTCTLGSHPFLSSPRTHYINSFFFFSIFNITSSTIISGCISSNLFSFTVMLKGKVSTISTSISSLSPYFQITKNWSFANVTSDSKGTIPFTLLLFDLPATSGTDD